MTMLLFVAVFFWFCATDHVLTAYRRSVATPLFIALQDTQSPLTRNLVSFPVPGCVLRRSEIACILALALAIHLGWYMIARE